jgi:chromosome segregation ATPase
MKSTMGLFNFYEAAKRAIQDVVSPELQFLKGQLQALSAEIRRLDEKIDSKHAEVLAQIHRLDEKIDSKHAEVLSEFRRLDEKIDSTARRLDEKIDSLDQRLSDRIDSLDKKIDFAIRFHERLARVEAKLDLSPP